MIKTLPIKLSAKSRTNPGLIFNRAGWGLLGGLAGTLVMDLLLMGTLGLAGISPLTCFSIVGRTVAQIVSIPGIQPTGEVSLGIATHYIIGPLVGVLFIIAVIKGDPGRVCTLKKSILIAVLYVEILSQPILALASIVLEMSKSETLQWFCGGFVMHLIMGSVLGIVVHRSDNGWESK